MDRKTCTKCGQDYPVAEFTQKSKHSSGRKPWCRSCAAADNRGRYVVRRQRMDTIKTLLGCADCGYSAHPAALHFDHLPGATKLFNIGTALGRTGAALEAEIAKCDVVCANCHAVRTASRRAA